MKMGLVKMGMGMMYGGGDMSGGMGGGEMTGEKVNVIKQFLDGLPPWLSTIIMLLAVVLIALIVGKIIGKIIGNLIYPDPEKESIFNLKQRLAIFLVVVLTLGVSGFMIYKSQNPAKKDDIMASESGDGMTSDMLENGEGSTENGEMLNGESSTENSEMLNGKSSSAIDETTQQSSSDDATVTDESSSQTQSASSDSLAVVEPTTDKIAK
ncbi:MAG: hypothetical protein RSF81_05675 [Oscillospiraceae bacterium]